MRPPPGTNRPLPNVSALPISTQPDRPAAAQRGTQRRSHHNTRQPWGSVGPRSYVLTLYLLGGLTPRATITAVLSKTPAGTEVQQRADQRVPCGIALFLIHPILKRCSSIDCGETSQDGSTAGGNAMCHSEVYLSYLYSALKQMLHYIILYLYPC